MTRPSVVREVLVGAPVALALAEDESGSIPGLAASTDDHSQNQWERENGGGDSLEASLTRRREGIRPDPNS